MPKAIIPLAEVSVRTGTPVATLRYWRSKGGGPRTFRVGRRVMAFESEVDEWLQEQAAKEDRGNRIA
jgi:predicted DNA-binding transcriptional regulator AlpA